MDKYYLYSYYWETQQASGAGNAYLMKNDGKVPTNEELKRLVSLDVQASTKQIVIMGYPQEVTWDQIATFYGYE